MYKYKMNSRVRYSEVGPDRKLTLTSIIDYFQDCATFHSEDLGLGLDYLEENRMFWVLVSWHISVNRYPLLGENITIATWPESFRSFYANRNLVIYGPDDEVLAQATSKWMLVGMDSGKPKKPLPEQMEKYVTGPVLDMEPAPRKIHQPEDYQELEPVQVHRFMIDTNGHVNNGQYVMTARECLPEDFAVSQIRAEYRYAATLGDTLIPRVSSTGEGYIVSLINGEGKCCSVVEFK